MRYETAKAFRTSLEQRLKNEAQATGIALIRLRKRVAFERFLARLATSASSGWVLKGAFALELRLGLRTSATSSTSRFAARPHRHRRRGQDRTRCWLARLGSPTKLRPAT